MPPHDLDDLSFTPEEVRAMQGQRRPVEVRLPARAAARRFDPRPCLWLAAGAVVLLLAAFWFLASHRRGAPPPAAGPAAAASVAGAAGVVANARGRVNLRAEPSLAGGVIGSLPAGTPVEVLGHTPAGWVLVETESGRGFIWGGYVSTATPLPFRPAREGGEAVVVSGGQVLRP
jgi:hypothetical protein